MPLRLRPRAKLPLCRYMILAGRESMFVSVMAGGSQRGAKELQEPGKELAGAGFLLLRTISNFTYEMVDNQSETARTAVSGSIRHGCRCFRLVRFYHVTHFISEI